MKVRDIILLCSAAALPQLAMADLSVTNPAGLGQMRAFLDFCSQADPQYSASFKAEWQSIVGGQTSLLGKLEQSSAYKEQYAEFTSALQKLPPGEGQTICAVLTAVWNGGAVSGHENHGKDDHGKDDHGTKPNKGSDPPHKSGQDR